MEDVKMCQLILLVKLMDRIPQKEDTFQIHTLKMFVFYGLNVENDILNSAEMLSGKSVLSQLGIVWTLGYMDRILDQNFGQDCEIIQTQFQESVAREMESFVVSVKGF